MLSSCQMRERKQIGRAGAEGELDDAVLIEPAAGLGKEVGVHPALDADEGALPDLAGAGAVVRAAAAVQPDAVVLPALYPAPVHHDLALAEQGIAQQRGVLGIDVDAAGGERRGGEPYEPDAGAGVELVVGGDEARILYLQSRVGGGRGHDLLKFVRLFHRVGHEEREIFLFSSPGLRAVLRLYCHFEECVQIFLLVRRAVRNEVVSPDEGVHPLMNDEAKYIETCGSAIARLKSGAPYFPLGGK